MERDALLAHGAAYLLHDRLHTCSDYTVMHVCSACGSLLTPNQYIPTASVDMPRPVGGESSLLPWLTLLHDLLLRSHFDAVQCVQLLHVTLFQSTVE